MFRRRNIPFPEVKNGHSSVPKPLECMPKRQWAKNWTSSCCTKCKQQFSMVVRRHHCRVCGQLICKNCCYQYICKAPGSRTLSNELVCGDCAETRIVKCRSCQVEIPHGEGLIHLTTSCPRRRVLCPLCSSSFEAIELDSHMKSSCQNRVITCPQCGDKLQHKELKSHNESSCSRRIACPLKCGALLPPASLKPHVELCGKYCKQNHAMKPVILGCSMATCALCGTMQSALQQFVFGCLDCQYFLCRHCTPSYFNVECSYGCGEILEFGKLPMHCYSCIRNRVMCRYCGEGNIINAEITSHARQCTHYPGDLYVICTSVWQFFLSDLMTEKDRCSMAAFHSSKYFPLLSMGDVYTCYEVLQYCMQQREEEQEGQEGGAMAVNTASLVGGVGKGSEDVANASVAAAAVKVKCVWRSVHSALCDYATHCNPHHDHVILILTDGQDDGGHGSGGRHADVILTLIEHVRALNPRRFRGAHVIGVGEQINEAALSQFDSPEDEIFYLPAESDTQLAAMFSEIASKCIKHNTVPMKHSASSSSSAGGGGGASGAGAGGERMSMELFVQQRHNPELRRHGTDILLVLDISDATRRSRVLYSTVGMLNKKFCESC